ncbi:DUF3108 domain-containing protein [Idiomarina zobellii]|uniref:DUF3108 domain-containing protein n=1 Tax=Idiomarina zobellii TaxID=86103 RepID=A0A837NHS2_9GAMM|nr:DUF3108 domain-containing protein [Idiomarina zobellii]KPD24966.1 hypothetical protein AFK76_00970 [Idiomarina zobellii]SDF33757.1 Protein of unknown function [Idiomarina zobellii]
MLKRTMYFLMASTVLSFSQLAPVHADDTAKATQGINDTMKPYEANYVITRGDSEYGEGYRYLEVSPDNEWQLRTKSDISWFILSDTREARSVFIVDDENNRLEPREFIYMRTGTGSDKSFHGEFRADDKKVRNVDTGRMLDINWENALFDEANVIEQLRIDVSGGAEQFKYRVVNEKGEEDEYRFRVMAESQILSLPYGEVEAIKVGRVRDNNRRQTFFWFAPELNYVMVKMQQFKEGDEQATMSLRSLDM